ncbi:unnamed protein product [Allacma fusca]|uniref:Fido domain-containing protein n=1 Tax=Allacma fusca TaxID=39272 RepID=A0A8J2LJ34_9HEXA|nr:unnamed protein product [Allacma fusca]
MWYFKMVNWFSNESGLEKVSGISYDDLKATSDSVKKNVVIVSRKPSIRNPDEYIKISRKRMNAFVLTIVFLMGVLCALLLGFLQTDNPGRQKTFQPLPLVEHIPVGEDNEYLVELGSGLGIRIDPDAECEGDNPLGLELEAISAINVALEMKEKGKITKAQKLFQHAMALCPRHPDILINYGEFFETSRQDYLMADQLYQQALTFSPGNTKALTNRKRTSPVVEELDERRLERIDEKRDILIQMPESSAALKRVKKEAYFQQLYHTAGIEGNTMTLSETRFILETRLAVGGKSIMEHNEILGLDAAMKFINSSLVNRIGKITVDDILNIHKHLMGFVDPADAGRFRQTQVYVGGHTPPPPKIIPESIQQLIQWLNSEEALQLHPIHYAAIAHYKLVYIHPFTDGNGRTSRLLMNWVLMQAGYPPVIIRKQDRQLYYSHLDTANKGDIRPFIRFIADCTEKTVDVYLWATRELGHIQMLAGSDSEDESDTREKPEKIQKQQNKESASVNPSSESFEDL